MMSTTDIVQQEPPGINHSNKGRKPVLLNDNVVKVSLANPQCMVSHWRNRQLDKWSKKEYRKYATK